MNKFVIRIFEMMGKIYLRTELLKSFSQSLIPRSSYCAKSKLDNAYKSVLCLSESSMKEIEAI